MVTFDVGAFADGSALAIVRYQRDDRIPTTTGAFNAEGATRAEALRALAALLREAAAEADRMAGEPTKEAP